MSKAEKRMDLLHDRIEKGIKERERLGMIIKAHQKELKVVNDGIAQDSYQARELNKKIKTYRA
ncbi:MAG: hypothetical protein GY828_03980 [Candidatus Gracilibacteria bacterium]|nr:hypothetical protein [Candidatus Gracilibacteria bacterium]